MNTKKTTLTELEAIMTKKLETLLREKQEREKSIKVGAGAPLDADGRIEFDTPEWWE